MNKITIRDVWKDYVISVQHQISLLSFYVLEITYNHFLTHNGHINDNAELVCDYPISDEYIRLHIKDKHNLMTKPAQILFFLLKGTDMK